MEKVLKWLRGSHNSVRYRFIDHPRQWVEYVLLFRLRGKTWVDFYAHRLDRPARDTADEPIQEDYLERGRDWFAYIKDHGLQPEHKFLDYGCGVMRIGVPVINYLDPGNYVGLDISPARLARGHRLAAENGISDDRYQTFVVGDCKLLELGDQRFDFVWASSVLNHMPDADILEMLSAMRGHISSTGQFLFQYNMGEKNHRIGIKDFVVTGEKMQRWCEQAGFVFENLPSHDGTSYQLVRLTVSS
ncbi:MAG: class I SAM-dependent methyltransferase [Alphaproteobacteria bacterium]|jgi:SAM-dependent methyltransferase|nr:class I SAM-dependent methyltransferase [Alphaproteobacteria bacterium]